MDSEAYADMLPWLVFVVIDRKSGLGVAWASGVAAGCAAGLVAWSYWRGRHAPLPRLALVLFAVCLVSALASPAWGHEVSLPRALTVLALSAAFFASLLFSPLSEAYTAQVVAPSVREDPRFRRVNLEMTSAWAVGSLAIGIACGTTALLRGAVAFTLLDWVTPLLLAAATILWAARRWELFRLEIDAALDHLPAKRPGNRVRVERAGAQGATSHDVVSEDAVIHRFPLHRERNV